MRAHEAGDSIIVVGDVGDEHSCQALCLAILDFALERGPIGKPVLTREHELRVMQCKRGTGDLLIGSAGKLRVMVADALNGRRIVRLRRAEELLRLLLLLFEIRAIGQGSRGVRIGRHERPPSMTPDVRMAG
jgi:hypothetical protein